MKKENIHQTDRKNNKGCAYFVIALFILIPGFLSALFGGAGVFKGHIEFFWNLIVGILFVISAVWLIDGKKKGLVLFNWVVIINLLLSLILINVSPELTSELIKELFSGIFRLAMVNIFVRFPKKTNNSNKS